MLAETWDMLGCTGDGFYLIELAKTAWRSPMFMDIFLVRRGASGKNAPTTTSAGSLLPLNPENRDLDRTSPT